MERQRVYTYNQLFAHSVTEWLTGGTFTTVCGTGGGRLCCQWLEVQTWRSGRGRFQPPPPPPDSIRTNAEVCIATAPASVRRRDTVRATTSDTTSSDNVDSISTTTSHSGNPASGVSASSNNSTHEHRRLPGTKQDNKIQYATRSTVDCLAPSDLLENWGHGEPHKNFPPPLVWISRKI